MNILNGLGKQHWNFRKHLIKIGAKTIRNVRFYTLFDNFICVDQWSVCRLLVNSEFCRPKAAGGE